MIEKEIVNNNIEKGLDFILNHFNQIRLFPRTIMTKNLGYQKEVFSKEEAINFFKESDFIDCRINAYPSFTDYKGIQRYPPDFLFIDLDKSNFKTNKSFELALSNTLKNLGKKLLEGDANTASVLFTGNGYHIYQPVYCPTVLENVTEFSKFTDKPSQEFLKFAKDFLSNGKADKLNNPSFKSCLLRIPNSINSKNNTVVKVIQQWNGYHRPTITKELLLDFRRYLIQKKIDEYNYRQKRVSMKNKNSNNNSNYNHYHYYEWIEKLLQTPIEDFRKLVLWRILCPYLINVKRLSYEESFKILREWLDKCNSVRRLDFNSTQKGREGLKHVGNFNPIGIQKLKTDNDKYRKLYILLFKKKIINKELKN